MPVRLALAALALVAAATPAVADPLDPALYSQLKWRGIGPFRGGRTVGAAGVPGKPNVFFIGVNNGGVWKTTDAGRVWKPIFDDQPTGSIGALAVAASNPDVIYVGSGEGLQRPDLSTGDGVYVTRDGGKTWADVTPPGLTAWSKVAQLDAGRFADDTAYAAVNRIRLDDQRPHVYRTHDGGKTWAEIVRGLPDNAPVNAVREDPVRKGLLYAATERAVHVSFNDGDDWQPLRLNMPATSVRDLVIHDRDVVVGTHGRGFWILDDISPLRHLSAKTAGDDVSLFPPAPAYRVRRSVATDTPLPPDEPTAPNPPDGAVIDFRLKADAAGPVMLEILDSAGKLVRKFSSTDAPPTVDPKAVEIDPRWVRPARVLPAKAGSHRFVWDLHYPPPAGATQYVPISAVYGDTPTEPTGPFVPPGKYTVKLTAGGKAFERPLEVKMDPRVTTPVAGLEEQFKLSMTCYDGMAAARDAAAGVRSVRKQLADVKAKADKLADAIDDLDAKLAAIEGEEGRGRRRGGRGTQEPTLGSAAGEFGRLMAVVQGADATPTAHTTTGVGTAKKELDDLLSRWADLRTKEVADLNAKLKAAGLPPVTTPGR